MADTGRLATQELRSSSADEGAPSPDVPQVTSVANPRRIRLTRLTQDAVRAH